MSYLDTPIVISSEDDNDDINELMSNLELIERLTGIEDKKEINQIYEKHQISPKMGEKLGEGVYGKVKTKLYKGKVYAEKTFKNTRIDELFIILPEINTMMSINHPNILGGKLITANMIDSDDYKISMLMDIGVPLSQEILKGLTFEKTLQYIFNIGCAIDFLLRNGRAHCDLKLDNIIIHNGVAKLIDFGLITYIDPFVISDRINAGICNYEFYRPPEQLIGTDLQVTVVSEIWVYGGVVLSLLYGVEDILSLMDYKTGEKSSEDPLIYNRDSEPRKIFEDLYGEFPEQFISLLEDLAMLRHYDPLKRAKSLSSFLQNPLFVSHNLHYNPQIGSVSSGSSKAVKIQNQSIRNNISILLKWLVEVCIDYKVSLAVLSCCLDLVRRLYHKYPQYTTTNKLQLFGCACVEIASALYGFSIDSDWTYITDGSCRTEDVLEAIIDIIRTENGKFQYINIYDIAKNKDAFLISLKCMLHQNLFYRDDLLSSEKIAYIAIEKFPNDGKPPIYIGGINPKYEAIGQNIEIDIINATKSEK